MEKMANQTLQAIGRVFLTMTMGQILEVYPYVAELQSESGRVRVCPSRLPPRSGPLVGLDAMDHHVTLGPSHQHKSDHFERTDSRGNKTAHPQTVPHSQRCLDDRYSEEQSFPAAHHQP
jgi:hypothetical protein